jgi:TnpA family transposase
VPALYRQIRPKYFHRKRGVTWLNMISDQSVGLVAKVISGTPKDTLNVVDLVYNPDGGPRPEVLITDQGSYSDIVFGIVTLLGFGYRPVPADLPDTKLWRINPGADYGTLDRTARGQVDLGKIRRHWPDVLRVIASIHTREISAHDVIRIVQHDGRPTGLGEALAHYGRIFKTLHVLALADDPDYRRQLKGMRNLQEGRHDLGRHIFHGGKGELHRAPQLCHAVEHRLSRPCPQPAPRRGLPGPRRRLGLARAGRGAPPGCARRAGTEPVGFSQTIVASYIG